MLKAMAKYVKPVIRQMATEAGSTAGTAQSGHFSVPQWGIAATTIGAGVGLFGVFANILHGDNVMTRTELREDMQKLETRIDQRFEKVDQRFEKMEGTLKEISDKLTPPKPTG